ncbi:MAG: hypothetical protein ACYCSN_17255 [Acidobacteriaceae bacterium]
MSHGPVDLGAALGNLAGDAGVSWVGTSARRRRGRAALGTHEGAAPWWLGQASELGSPARCVRQPAANLTVADALAVGENLGAHTAGLEFIDKGQDLANPNLTEFVCSHGVSEKTQASLSPDSLKRWVRQPLTLGHGHLQVDVRLGYGPDTLYRLLEVYGPKGRTWFHRMLAADFIFPMVYSATLYSYADLVGTSHTWPLSMAKVAAITAAMFDYAENTMLVLVLREYPRRRLRVAMLAGMFTSLKMAAFAVAASMFLASFAD